MFKLEDRRIFTFWILTGTVIMFLIVSQLIQDGAFMDGMLYVSVSKNLAEGIGTFWDPHFCKTYQSSFHEQPPLYFGILALFYKLFGTSMYVERLFCFTCFAVTALYIHKFWKRIYTIKPLIGMNSWFPVLLWTIIPISFWAYTNFVEEVLMGVFDLIAVYYLFIGLFEKRRIVINIIIAGVFIFLASLTKGIQGMFPIVTVGFYWLITRELPVKKMLGYTCVLIFVPVLIYCILIVANEQVIISFEKYFQNRFVNTFNHKYDTTTNRFEILIQLFWHLLPIACISGIIIFFGRRHKHLREIKEKRTNQIILWLLAIGFSGSIPLIITLEQRGFYLVTTLPFFALAIAMWSAPYLSIFVNKIDIRRIAFRITNVIIIALFLISLIYSISRIGKAKRDVAMLDDVYTFGKILPYGTTVSIPAPMCLDFSFKEYMIRYFYISADDTPATHQYLICRKNLPKEWVPSAYEQCTVNTKEFDLYILKQNDK